MKKIKLNLESGDVETGEQLKIMIEGDSNMSFGYHDLIFKAGLNLLESVDQKIFFENNENGDEDYYELVNELEIILHNLKEV